MTKKIFIVVVLLLLTLSACTINGHPISILNEQLNGSGTIISEDREVSGIDKVDLQSIGNLTIVQGDAESLTITADDNLLPYITTEVVNGTLEIGMQPNLSLNPSKAIEYKLTVKSLSDITLSGLGNITADNLLSEDINIQLTGSGNLTIGELRAENGLLKVAGFGDITVDQMVVDQPTFEIAGSGNIKVDDLQAFTLALKISGFGNADLVGKATDQTIEILGSGNFHGQDLESENATVKITGLGDATVWAANTLDVTITGSGNLEYYGTPKVTQTMTGFGKVNSLGEH